jgi:pimeloyl-ACP methyl ester carboxylesterase
MTREGSADYTRPLLLLNGIGARFEMWLPFCDALARRPILLFDIPGISGNPAREFPNQMPGLAQWLTKLMDVMDVDEADVLGYSWGGLLAQQLALDAPRRVRSLILTSTNFGFGAIPLPGVPDVLQLLNFIPGIGSDDPWVLWSTVLGGAPAAGNPVELIGNAINPLTSPFVGYQYQVAALAGWSSLARLGEIGQPTLVIAGADDSLIPQSTVQLLAQSIPNARKQFLATGGHLLPVNQPGALASAVDTFLREYD